MSTSTQEPTQQNAGPLSRNLTVLLMFAAATITILGMRAAAGIIGPAFLALMLTIAVHPLRGVAARRGWPAWVGSMLGLISVYVILIGMTVLMIGSLARFATLLPTYAPEFNDLVSGLQSKLQDAGISQDQTSSVIQNFNPSRLASILGTILSSLVDLVGFLIFVGTALLFMWMDAKTFPSRIGSILPERTPLYSALSSFAHGTRVYLVVSAIFGGIVAVIDTGMLWVLGIPVPVLWGILAFITNFIPNIGFIIGLIPPAGLALLVGGPGLMLLVIALYCLINFVLQSVIQPKYVADSVGLSVTVTFVSLLFWAWVLGALGALLAVPLSLLVKALFIDFDAASVWAKPLIAGVAVEPPDTDPETATDAETA